MQIDSTVSQVIGDGIVTTPTSAIASNSTEARSLILSVVVVSYNTRQMTIDCLRSLYSDLGGMPAEVFVVDNASADGSPAAIADAFPAIHIIANSRNIGFGAANNQALLLARGKFLMLLNSDAFPRVGAVSALVKYLEEHTEAGVVGPRLFNADGTIQQSCYRFPTPGLCWRENLWIAALFRNHKRLCDYRHWAHDTQRDVDWIIGACMLIRREVYDQNGGFDERFFMYAEEADLQRRIHVNGWKIAFTPQAEVVHLGGASGAGDLARVNRHFFESLDRYLLKHHGITGFVLMRCAMVLGCLVRFFLWSTAALFGLRQRRLALRKMKQHLWLVVRQATHWGAIWQNRASRG